MRKRVYIAGPISKGDLAHNVNQATEAFTRLAKAGFAPFCPHWSVYSKPAQKRRKIICCVGCRADAKLPIGTCDDCQYVYDVVCLATTEGNDRMSHQDWLGVDLPWVGVSEAVLRLPGESSGADMEVECAKEHGIPVFHRIEDLMTWFAAEPVLEAK